MTGGQPSTTRLAIAASVACGLLVIVATRRAPHLSPDSMTYLSAAEHLRSGFALSDFTGEPLTVFPPLYPLMLAPGGTSLLWVRLVGAVSVAAATLLMSVALRRRVRPLAAIAGAVAFGASQGLLRVASAAWSEAPYAAIALGMIVVLGTTRMTPRRRGARRDDRRARIPHPLRRDRARGDRVWRWSSSELRRDAGREDGATRVLRSAAAYAAAVIVVAGGWVLRNIVRTGDAFGPRFEGGAGEDLTTLLGRPLPAIGELVVGERPSDAVARVVGLVAIVALAAAAAVASRRRPMHPLDAGMVVFAATSLVVPVVARAVTANDIEYRVMSPMLIPLVYAGTIVVDRLWRRRTGGDRRSVVGEPHRSCTASCSPHSSPTEPISAPATAGCTCRRCTTSSTNCPPTSPSSRTTRRGSGGRRDGSRPCSRSPGRGPGNSHVPLTLDETVDQICARTTYLAWFAGLQNAGEGPAERRPEIVEVVDLITERTVPGGVLYRLALQPDANGDRRCER